MSNLLGVININVFTSLAAGSHVTWGYYAMCTYLFLNIQNKTCNELTRVFFSSFPI